MPRAGGDRSTSSAAAAMGTERTPWGGPGTFSVCSDPATRPSARSNPRPGNLGRRACSHPSPVTTAMVVPSTGISSILI